MKVYQTSRNVTQYVCDVRRDAEREGDRGRGRGRKREREVALVCNNIVIPYVREQCVESQQENLMEAVSTILDFCTGNNVETNDTRAGVPPLTHAFPRLPLSAAESQL